LIPAIGSFALACSNVPMSGDYPLFDAPAKKEAKAPLTVSQLSQLIEAVLETTFHAVWVVGEVAEVSRPHSGHVYFTLRDETSQIRAVMWRSLASRTKFRLEEGQQVLCHGAIDVYPPRGTYQLDVQRIEPAGLGSLQLAFKQLHQKLAAEGLFDPARKRLLPAFPRRVGFVTSPTGAAIHDFLQIASRRCCGVQIFVIPARVQGDGAAEEIARGIRLANRLQPPLDVLVVGRGGGSIEDLWSFNEEVVVRAIVASRVPVVSAVGHEIDVTLADLAADVLALTPSEAAERVIPSAQELSARLAALQRRMTAMLRSQAAAGRRHVEQLARSRILRNPKALVYDLAQRLDDLDGQALKAIKRRFSAAGDRLASIACRAEALSPVKTLARGFSVTTLSDGSVVRTADQVTAGDVLRTRVQQGTIESIVSATEH
jgi:exodeoxyribonuclease VII large subunit